jgi:hypothetical protein
MLETEIEFAEGDWTTPDGNRFYQDGKLVLDASEMSDRQARRAAALEMKRQQFWPNVWYLSDHGNLHPFTF